MAYVPGGNEPLLSNPGLHSSCVIERALVVNLKPGKDLTDALQVAKSIARTVFHSKDVKFTDILRVNPCKYVVLLEVVQNADVGMRNAKSE